VREEVRVSRTATQQERRVEGDVRREEARIDRTDEPGRSAEAEEEPPRGIRGDEEP
jgi:stress response protein YsnF